MSGRGRLLLVADHRMMREALAVALREEGFEVTATAPDLTSAGIECRTYRPDLLLLDPSPDDSALHELQSLKREFADLPVLLLVKPEDQQVQLDWLSAGASGFFSPAQDLRELLRTIEAALQGELVFSQDLNYSMFNRLARLDRESRTRSKAEGLGLTNREQQVLGLVSQGFDNRKIANELCLSLHTIKNHVHHLLRKLGVHSRLEAAAEVQRRGLLVPLGDGPATPAEKGN